MKLFLTKLIIFLEFAIPILSAGIGRISNGVKVQYGKKYMCSLQAKWSNSYYFTHFCGCAIISDRFVITAAHCIDPSKDDSWYRITAGSLQWRYGQPYEIDQTIVHENYNSFNHDNDIALIRIKGYFNLYDGSVGTINLPSKYDQLPFYQKANIAGWGVTFYGGQNIQEELLEADITVLQNSDLGCQYYINFMSNNMFCAGNNGYAESDSCQGDSGGPLVYQNKIIGIVSFGTECNKPDKAGVYTKVANYVDWILNKMQSYTSTNPPSGEWTWGTQGTTQNPNNGWTWGPIQTIQPTNDGWTWGTPPVTQNPNTGWTWGTPPVTQNPNTGWTWGPDIWTWVPLGNSQYNGASNWNKKRNIPKNN